MADTLPLRNEVSDEITWDISALFSSDEAFYQTLEKTTAAAKTFNENYVHQLDNPTIIEKALAIYSDILIELDKIANYAELRLSVDTINEHAQTLTAKFSNTYGKIDSELSFIESKILALSDDTFKRFISTSIYPHFLEKLKPRKPYQLSPEVEKTLASLSSVFERPFE